MPGREHLGELLRVLGGGSTPRAGGPLKPALPLFFPPELWTARQQRSMFRRTDAASLSQSGPAVRLPASGWSCPAGLLFQAPTNANCHRFTVSPAVPASRMAGPGAAGGHYSGTRLSCSHRRLAGHRRLRDTPSVTHTTWRKPGFPRPRPGSQRARPTPLRGQVLQPAVS